LITGVFHQRINARPDEIVGLSIHAEATYLFDAETGKRLV
jgi:multiple sugar transport system ATP-binding protein